MMMMNKQYQLRNNSNLSILYLICVAINRRENKTALNLIFIKEIQRLWQHRLIGLMD